MFFKEDLKYEYTHAEFKKKWGRKTHTLVNNEENETKK